MLSPTPQSIIILLYIYNALYLGGGQDFWATVSCSLCLFLALYLEITPEDAQGTIPGVEIKHG